MSAISPDGIVEQTIGEFKVKVEGLGPTKYEPTFNTEDIVLDKGYLLHATVGARTTSMTPNFYLKFWHSGIGEDVQYASRIYTPLPARFIPDIIDSKASDLNSLIANSRLSAGQKYGFWFYTIYVQPLTGKLKIGPFDFYTATDEQKESIKEYVVLTAANENTFEKQAQSLTYGDGLEFDFTSKNCLPESSIIDYYAGIFYFGQLIRKNGKIYTPKEHGVDSNIYDPETDSTKWRYCFDMLDINREGVILRRTIKRNSLSYPCDVRTMKWARCNPRFIYWDGSENKEIPTYEGTSEKGKLYKENDIVYMSLWGASPANLGDPYNYGFIPVCFKNYLVGTVLAPRYRDSIEYQIYPDIDDYQEYYTLHYGPTGENAIDVVPDTNLRNNYYGDIANGEDAPPSTVAGIFDNVFYFYDSNSRNIGNTVGPNGFGNTLVDSFINNKLGTFFNNTLTGGLANNVQLGNGQFRNWICARFLLSIQNNVIYDNVHNWLIGAGDIIRNVFCNANSWAVLGTFENNYVDYENMGNVAAVQTFTGNTLKRGNSRNSYEGVEVSSCEFNKENTDNTYVSTVPIKYITTPPELNNKTYVDPIRNFFPSVSSDIQGEDNNIIGGFSTIKGKGNSGMGQGFDIEGNRTIMLGRAKIIGNSRLVFSNFICSWLVGQSISNILFENWGGVIPEDFELMLDGTRTIITLPNTYAKASFRKYDYVTILNNDDLFHLSRVENVDAELGTITLKEPVPSGYVSTNLIDIQVTAMPIALYANQDSIEFQNSTPVRWLDPITNKWNDENVLTAPDLSKWQIVVDNAGNLSTVSV